MWVQKSSIWRILLIVLLGILFVLNGRTALRAAQDRDSLGQSDPLEPQALYGHFTIIWGDPRPGARVSPRALYMLSDTHGNTIPLFISEKLLQHAGGILRLNRRFVRVSGVWTKEGAFRVSSLHSDADVLKRANTLYQDVKGNKPYISILCKFADIPDEPRPLSYFLSMYSNTYPGLGHYWQELSYGNVNLEGSGAVGWYTLPHERSYYIYDRDDDGQVEADLSLLQDDCLAVADADVYFPNYAGANLVFNGELDGYAWGGGATVRLDGVSKFMGLTWLPPWGFLNASVVEHEMGHSFGLPHSSGPYGQVYDNVWDVMSNTWAFCSITEDPQYGCLGQHTIAYHKDILGWIPSSEKYIPQSINAQTVVIDRLALPSEPNTYKMVQIPIQGSDTHFYTVEVRDPVGYDSKLPGPAVIIHEVDTTRSEPAHVIDADGNGDTSDEGAMWRVGETFYDSENQISISVDAKVGTGFRVTINYLPVPTPLSPRNQAILLPGDVTISWSEIEGARSYELQIDTTPSFDSQDLMQFTPLSNAFVYRFDKPGTYYWRVRISPEASYSSVSSFTIALPFTQLTTHSSSDDYPSMIRTSDGTLWLLWQTYRSGNGDIWYATSTDNGMTWSAAHALISDWHGDYTPAVLQTSDGKLWVVWDSTRSGNHDIWYITSDDQGLTWSSPHQLTTDSHNDESPAIAQSGDGAIWIVWQSDRLGSMDIWYTVSRDGGATWSSPAQFTDMEGAEMDPQVIFVPPDKLWIGWMASNNSWTPWGTLYYKISDDWGKSWSTPHTLQTNSSLNGYLALEKSMDGTIWAAWAALAYYGEQRWGWDVWYATTSDDGQTWSLPHQLTRFVGQDKAPALVSLSSGQMGIAWMSDRKGNPDIWFAISGVMADISPEPYVWRMRHAPSPNPDTTTPVTITASVADEKGVESVHLLWWHNEIPQPSIEMRDDGLQGDVESGDGIYTTLVGPFSVGTQVTYTVKVIDVDGNAYTVHPPGSFNVIEPFTKTGDILLVVDAGGFETAEYSRFYTDTLSTLGYSYDFWDTALRGAPTEDILKQYIPGIVIWAMPWWGYLARDATPLQNYLDAGGRLFITGQDIAYYHYADDFLTHYLHAIYVQNDTDIHTVEGIGGDPISDGLTLSLVGEDSAYNQYAMDEVDTVSPAIPIFHYGGTSPISAGPTAVISSGTAGLRVDTGIYKLVYFAFGFEGINGATVRQAVMRRVLDWLSNETSYVCYDFDNSGLVDNSDILRVASHWHQHSEDADWDERLDVNHDNIIDVIDVLKIAKQISKHCSRQ